MVDKDKIVKLSQVFVPYRTYPVIKHPRSPIRCFQRLYPENHFSSQIEMFLGEHNYDPSQRGADLPWWGSKYFTDESGSRVMIISQDSLAKDAGSIVFWACIFPIAPSEEEYRKFTQEVDSTFAFAFKSWEKIRKLLVDWEIDLQFCYITDASKVYKASSRKDRDFDKQKSKELLESEIACLDPDLIILLGSSSLSRIDTKKNYGSVVEAGEPFCLRGKKYVVAPFPIGRGPTQRHFEERLAKASSLIKKLKN